jgi:hypothetical protein
MKHAPQLPALLLLTSLLAGCAGTGVERDLAVERAATPAETEKKALEPGELETLEHKLVASQAKLEIAQLKAQGQELQHANQLAHAEAEVEMAQAKLDNSLGVELPGRRAKAELDLQGSRDSAQEAAEELAQLELMYQDQDLADMTREFVIGRGRRRAERAARRLELQESELQSLVDYELGLEQRHQELALRQAQEKLAKLRFDRELERRGQELEIREAEQALRQAQRALDKAREGEVQP